MSLSLPEGRQVAVEHTPQNDERYADLAYSVNDTFKRARRQLQDQVRLTQRQTKRHAVSPVAAVKRLEGKKGFWISGNHRRAQNLSPSQECSRRPVTFEVHPPTREQGSDRPGRVYQSQGTARSAMEETDRHSEAERIFLAKVAERLNSHVRDNTIKQLMLIAPPKALGTLREHLLPFARATVLLDIANDFVKLPIPEIEKHLAG